MYKYLYTYKYMYVYKCVFELASHMRHLTHAKNVY